MTEHELTLTATASDGQTTQNTHVNVPDVILIDRALLTELTADRDRLNRELQAIWEQLAPYAETDVFCPEIELGKILERLEFQRATIERLKRENAQLKAERIPSPGEK